MESIGYDYNFWWSKSGIRCGFDAAPTKDEIMLKIFDTEPNWNNYEAENANTQKAMGLF